MECVKRRLQSFVLEISLWTMFHSQVDQLEVDSDQIKTLIKNNQCYTTQEIVNTLKISKSIKLLVKMKMCLLFYGKKTYRCFGQPNKFS